MSLVAAAGMLMLDGCGGGDGRSGGGRLNMRALWQQRAGASGAAGESAWQPQASSGFGEAIPAAVATVRVIFESPRLRCCLAIDPRSAALAQRLLVLDTLPGGSAVVTLAGFATDFAPADGVSDTCATDPPGVGQACDSSRPATPSFLSGPMPVTVVPNAQADAGDIEIPAVPFLIGVSPAPDASVAAPVSIRFTVADAMNGIAPGSIAVEINPAGALRRSVATTLTACADDASLCGTSSAPPCSAGGALRACGFTAETEPLDLAGGPAQVTIRARNRGTPPSTLEFNYAISIAAGAPPATNTAVTIQTQPATPTKTTGLPAPTSTPTEVLTHGAEPTNTYTVASTAQPTQTPTNTAVVTPTFSESPVATFTTQSTPPPTATRTPTAVGGPATSTPTPLRTLTPTPIFTGGTALIVGSAAGNPGETVSFPVLLVGGNVNIAGTENDITFDPMVATIPPIPGDPAVPDCVVDPDIQKEATSFAFLPSGCSGTGCTSVRAIVISLSNPRVTIPDFAVLYTCNLAIAADAPQGLFPLTISSVLASDPDAQEVPIAGVNGVVFVGFDVTPTPTPSPTTTPLR